MPAKLDPNDWDRLFAPNAPRRGGPLRVLVNVLIASALIGALFFGANYAIQTREQQVAAGVGTATAFSLTAIPMQTATAEANAHEQATTVAIQTATALARSAIPTERPSLGVGSVVRGGNLRSEPIVAPETVVGLVWPGDQVEFLERRDLSGQIWFYIRITSVAANRGGAGVSAGTEGWASGSLLSPIAAKP